MRGVNLLRGIDEPQDKKDVDGWDKPGHDDVVSHQPASVDIRWVGPLVELDIGAPRISDERECCARALLGIRAIELDAVGFELLDETLQVDDIEADVVEHAALGGGECLWRLVETQLRARHVGDRVVVAH